MSKIENDIVSKISAKQDQTNAQIEKYKGLVQNFEVKGA